MHKAAARHADLTSTGGAVLAFSSSVLDDGKRVALSGDAATCGKCTGTHRILGTGKGRFQGRAVVIDGDRVLCPCGKNRVVVGAAPGLFFEVDDLLGASDLLFGQTRLKEPQQESGEITPSSYAEGGAADIFDEMVVGMAQDGPVADYPFFVETSDGQLHFGYTDALGQLPRITTAAQGSITVYWGDEALAKWPGEQDA